MRDTSLLQQFAFSAAAAGILASALTLAACGASGNTFTTPTTLTKCAVSFDPSASSLPAAGGAGTFAVQTERECQWTATPDGSWLSITSGNSGQGPGTVQFAATPNMDPVGRAGALVVNDGRVQVTQAAGECTYQLAQPSASFPQAGGSGTVELRASSALCQWTASANVNWITIASAASGKGSASVAFNVSPTTGPPRTGALTIAGQPFPVTQSEGCTYTVAPLSATVDPSGGARTLAVSTAAGCPWTAAAHDPWIAVTAGAAGTASGSVSFTVAATSGPSRTGALTVAGQTVTVVQSQGCSLAIDPTTASIPPDGGSGTVGVTAGAGCSWTALSNVSWITVASGATGSGNGAATFNVAETTGPGRSGTLTIAGQTFTVNQGQGCAFTLSAGSASAPAAGATGAFDVRTSDGCGWTAASNADWLRVAAAAAGTGAGTVQYSVAANPGPARTGAITAGGQSFTVAQDAGCAFSILPATQNTSSAGGNASVAVTAAAGCSWSTTSAAPWIAVSSGQTGSGNGTVQLMVAPNTGAERTGLVTIADQTATIIQASGCSAVVAPDTLGVPAGAGTQTISITTDAACSWTAVSTVPWMTIPGASSGGGNGSVQLAVAANAGPARSGTSTIAGHTVTVNQDSGCTFAVSPSSQDVAQPGGSGAVTMTASDGCAWTAASNAPWITVTAGATGSGSGTVQFSVDVNTTGAPRSGTIAIAGQVFTVNQAGM
ncbi:MAG TPA: BACON domain-containing carbohydrate-binding protein [Vicinamibacterales bacterium]